MNLTCEVSLKRSTFVNLVWARGNETIAIQTTQFYGVGPTYKNRITRHELTVDDAAGTATHTITVENVTKADEGLYMCVASTCSSHGQVSGTIPVKFKGSYSYRIRISLDKIRSDQFMLKVND